MQDSHVMLNIKEYNRMKTSEIRANVIIDFLFNNAVINNQQTDLQLSWNEDKLADLLNNVYPERFRNLVENYKTTIEVEDEKIST